MIFESELSVLMVLLFFALVIDVMIHCILPVIAQITDERNLNLRDYTIRKKKDFELLFLRI